MALGRTGQRPTGCRPQGHERHWFRGLIQGHTIQLHPRMRFETAAAFSYPELHLRVEAMPVKECPQDHSPREAIAPEWTVLRSDPDRPGHDQRLRTL
jgi:hypothetical protein